ncbi:MAG: zinc ribbon domain-containing protein [Methanoregulaceae archaeon]
MDLPELKSGERGLIKSPGVQIKKVPFDAFLTSERVILRPAGNSSLPQKDIPLDTIESAVPGENENREPFLLLSVYSPDGDSKRMIITFPRTDDKARHNERDRWVMRMSEKRSGPAPRERGSETKDRREKIPNEKPTFHDGIHIHREPPARVSKGDLQFNTPGRAKKEHGESLTFRNNGISNEDLTGRAPATERSVPPGPSLEDYEVPPQSAAPSVREPCTIPSAVPEAAPAQANPPPGNWFFCNKCGNRLPVGSIFCNQCGSRVVAPSSVPITDPEKTVTEYSASGPGGHLPASAPAYQAPPEQYRAPAEPPAPKPEFDLKNFPVEPVRQKGLFSLPESAPVKKKRSLLPGFSFLKSGRKKAPKEKPVKKERPLAPTPGPVAEPLPGGRRRPPKKVIIGIVAAVLVVAAVIGIVMFGGSLFSGSTSEGGSATTSSGSGTSATSAATATPTATTASSGSSGSSSTSTTTSTSTATSSSGGISVSSNESAPSTGVYVYADYLGKFTGLYGTTGNEVSVSGSATKYYEISDATGTVSAGFKKADSSTKGHTLTVRIYKDGTILKEGTTTDTGGVVNITATV